MPASLPVRLVRCVAGLILCGTGIGLMVEADLGLSPWDVFHQGVTDQTGISIGVVTIIVGALVLVAWIPIRERPGIGTVLNVILIGLSVDATIALVPSPDSLATQLVMVTTGVLLWGPGSGLYIGAGLGPGPRDGLMTGLARRGWASIGWVRTAIEVTALVAGVLLGGTAGLGTILFALTIGPNVAFWLPRLRVSVEGPTDVDRSSWAGSAANPPLSLSGRPAQGAGAAREGCA